MTNIVMLGGNGYIGRNTTKAWMDKDPTATFYVVSRSGKSELHEKRVIPIQADASDADEVGRIISVLPENIDYIVSFVGCAAVPKGSTKSLAELNMEPAVVERKLAEHYHVRAQGAIGGKLGSKEFVAAKSAMLDYLRQSQIPTEAVEPTLVYGAGRSDALARMVPLLKFCGLFSKRMRPVRVEEVAHEMVEKMTRH